MFFLTVNLGEMVMCLEDLINYFAQPEDDMGTSIMKKINLLFNKINFKFQNTKRNKIVFVLFAIDKIFSKRKVS